MIDKEKGKTEVIIKDNNQTVQMRLFTTIAFLFMVFLFSFLGKASFPIIVSVILLIWIIEQFLFFLIIKRQKIISIIDNIFFGQFIFDLSILTLIIHYIGGAEWVGGIFYFFSITYLMFHISQRNRKMFLVIFAFLLYSILILSEYFGIISHYGIIPSSGAYQDFYYVMITISAVGGVFFLMAFTINTFANRLKKRTKELEEIKITLQGKIKLRTEKLKSLKENLEQEVRRRTKELKKRVDELERFYKLTIGRETKMMELKEEIKKLKEQK